jgi:dienelactone hydrolase
MPALFLALAALATVQAPSAIPLPLTPRAWLVIEPVDRRGRRPFRPDAVFAAHLLDRAAPPPREGDALTGETGDAQRWRRVEADANGAIPGTVGYAYAAIESPEDIVVLARLSGALGLYVNGAGFCGDVYGYGFGGVPVALRKGVNHVYVSGSRGAPSLVFERPAGELVFGTWDFTLPHADPERPLPFSLLVLNATRRELVRQSRASEIDAGSQIGWEWPGRLPPLSLARGMGEVAAPAADGARDFAVDCVVTYDGSEPVRTTVRIPFAAESGARLVPYTSRIDDSLQTVAVSGAGRPVLSLHGASVDAWSQVTSYGAREGYQLLAPRNRRPYGFDWQDWGRADAYEALAAVRHGASERVFVTGHSMGGHGTWHLAANDPDRFLALAASAGWCSFDTYGSRPQGELRELWHAADGASRTEELVTNLAQLPVFVLHGEADDNVPASEGRAMLERLEKAGAKPQSHFQPGAGHWWDGDKASGADCVDWPGIFELFDATEEPERAPDELHWRSIDPGVDATHHWLRVEQPLVYGKPFEVQAKRGAEVVEVRTQNVRWLAVENAGGQRSFALDGQTLETSAWSCTHFERDGEFWRRAYEITGRQKRAGFCGPFKRAFDRGFVLVHGSTGSDAEDLELYERARADQQQWWYRANGVPELIDDLGWRDAVQERNQAMAFEHVFPVKVPSNVVLYGNEDSNTAWNTLVTAEFPIRVRRGYVQIGERRYEGDHLACVFVAPRADDPNGSTLVGAFGSTGIAGARLSYTLQPFTSGVGYPDYVIYSTDVLGKGDGGVLEAGWFDRDWKLQPEGAFRR